MAETKLSSCPICGVGCGLLVEVEGGRAVSIKGDMEDPHSRGHVCPKGLAIPDLLNDPDRVVEPLKKSPDGSRHAVDWDAALDDISGRLAKIIKKHGRDAVGVYVGTSAIHQYSSLLAVAAFALALDTKNLFTANSMDSLPRQLASALLYGNSGMLPVPDVSRTDYFLVIGANPAITGGSIMSAPGFARHAMELKKRGGKLVVLDPRKTETASLANEHHFIRPGSDSLFLLAAIHTIFEEGLDIATEQPVRGLDKLREVASRFTPEAVAAATGIDAETTKRIAREFAMAGSAACYSRMGACAQLFGTTASWLTDALNIVTGNIDRPGGIMFPSPAVDLSSMMAAFGMKGDLGRWKTRLGDLPEFNNELPSAALASEIETPGDRQVRALVVIGGNPCGAIPDTARINAAFGKLEFMVALDPYISATSRHADYVLPPSLGVEYDNYQIVPYATAIKNVAKYTPAAVAPPPGVRHIWDILRELTLRITSRKIGAPNAVERMLLSTSSKFDPKNLVKMLLAAGPNGVSAKMKSGRAISFRHLVREPHGIDLGLHEPALERMMKSRRIDAAPEVLLADIPRLEAFMRESTEQGLLTLINRRQLRFMNTCMHNIEKLAAGPELFDLEIHPYDAADRGISDGDVVKVSSRIGEIQTPAKLTDAVMRGTVCLPFGWSGDVPGAAMSVCKKHPGRNINEIIDGTLVDTVSGMSALNSTQVTVEPVQ